MCQYLAQKCFLLYANSVDPRLLKIQNADLFVLWKRRKLTAFAHFKASCNSFARFNYLIGVNEAGIFSHVASSCPYRQFNAGIGNKDAALGIKPCV